MSHGRRSEPSGPAAPPQQTAFGDENVFPSPSLSISHKAFLMPGVGVAPRRAPRKLHIHHTAHRLEEGRVLVGGSSVMTTIYCENGEKNRPPEKKKFRIPSLLPLSTSKTAKPSLEDMHHRSDDLNQWQMRSNLSTSQCQSHRAIPNLGVSGVDYAHRSQWPSQHSRPYPPFNRVWEIGKWKLDVCGSGPPGR